MNFKSSYLKLIRNQVRSMSSKPKNHYNSLGIKPSSTQGEVKSAYYKLSMQYHPDKNQSVESSDKFRDITEAYEVLGNVRTRRLYDKGLHHIGTTPDTADDPASKFYKSREMRSRPPPPTGRTPIYDFDEWSKMHYGATFQRTMKFKKQEQMQRAMREDSREIRKIENVLFVLLFVFTMFMTLFYEKPDYDKNNILSSGQQSKTQPEN